jgi:hypothetical protein
MKNFYRAIFCLSICFSTKANSQILITLSEVGGNVVGTLSGSFSNINGLTQSGSSWSNSLFGGMDPADPVIFINPVRDTSGGPPHFSGVPTVGSTVTGYTGFTLTGTLGSGTSFNSADSATGSNAYTGTQHGLLLLPLGATSGTFNSTATWNGHTFANLGLTAGNSVSITWDGGNESMTINVVAVPEPSTYAAITSLVCMGAVVHRRRLKSKALTA